MSACEATSGCYELYSIGSAKFLREIFNSVAMITGSGDFLGACAVAIMLGVILAVIKGIMTGGGKIEVGAIVVSSLVTCIMFVPRATVVVEDVYNGSTYAVDNVPIGVAAPGMFISRVGFTIAELMDQGFSTVDTNFGITNRPFLESTKILSNLRNPQFANSVWDQLGKHTNSDVKRSFYNFFKECTMLKYNFDKTKSVDQDQKMTLENLMDDFQSNVFYTEIYVDGKAVTKTCNDANAILKSKINQLNGDLVNNAMPAPKEYGSNTATEMTDAISMLRLTSADAMEMVKLSIVQPVYDKALAGYFDNSGDVVAALTINNAIQQRNAQWSMEQSLFLNTVRPIITFFEGFVYAVTPFMAILICMGAFGLGIAVKYFQTLIWIQLWMPILAIINLYIYMSAQGAVDSAGIVDKHIDSFYALGTLAQTVETWTSVGGMLAAMTPVIAFFIVAGSAYTFTSIASKLNGADHIDEKAMSPDVLKQAPMMTNTAGSYYSREQGTGKTDFENNIPSISLDNTDANAIQQVMSQGKQTQISHSHSIVKSTLDAISGGKVVTTGEQFVDTFSKGFGAIVQSIYNEELSRNNGNEQAAIRATAETLTTMSAAGQTNLNKQETGKSVQADAQVKGSKGKGSGSAGAGAGAEVQESTTASESQIRTNTVQNSNTNSNSNSSTDSQGTGTSLKKGTGININDSDLVNLAKAILGSDMLTGSDISTDQDLKSKIDQFTETDSLMSQYSNTDSTMKSTGWKQSFNLQQLAYRASNELPNRLENLEKNLTSAEDRESITRLANTYQQMGISANQAKSMAILQTAHNGKNIGNKAEVADMINDLYQGGNEIPNKVVPIKELPTHEQFAEGEGENIKEGVEEDLNKNNGRRRFNTAEEKRRKAEAQHNGRVEDLTPKTIQKQKEHINKLNDTNSKIDKGLNDLFRITKANDITLEHSADGKPCGIRQGGKYWTLEELERQHGTNGFFQKLLSWGTSAEDSEEYKRAIQGNALSVKTNFLDPKLEKYSESGIRELVNDPNNIDAQKKYAKFAGINLDTNEGQKLMNDRIGMLQNAKSTLDKDNQYNYSLKAHAILTMLSEDEVRGNNVKSIKDLNENIARQQKFNQKK